jgi:hypothetical protein
MKLELKHLAAYLPYGLKCKILNYKSDYVGEKDGVIDGYYFYAGEPHFYLNNGKSRGNAGKSLDHIKPILRPLSDIYNFKYKPRYGNNEFLITEVIPIEVIEVIECGNIDEIPHYCFKLLVKHHFDVFRLINKGLAIDINTI